MHKVRWSLNDTSVHLPASLPLIKNERRVVYDTPDYNELQDKENVAENFSHLSGAPSEFSSSLLQFYGSDTSKVDPCGGGGCADPVSMSALCLSPVKCNSLQKRKVEYAGG